MKNFNFIFKLHLLFNANLFRITRFGLLLNIVCILSMLSCFVNAQVVETPPTGNWICPAGVTSVTVECWGGGGAGGGATGKTGGGSAPTWRRWSWW